MAADRRGHLALVFVPDDISGREAMRDICAQGFIHYHFAAVIGLYSGPFNGDFSELGRRPVATSSFSARNSHSRPPTEALTTGRPFSCPTRFTFARVTT